MDIQASSRGADRCTIGLLPAQPTEPSMRSTSSSEEIHLQGQGSLCRQQQTMLRPVNFSKNLGHLAFALVS